MLLPIYSQPCWQRDLFKNHNSVHMILLIQTPFSITPSITLFCSSVLQVTQALRPELCLSPAPLAWWLPTHSILFLGSFSAHSRTATTHHHKKLSLPPLLHWVDSLSSGAQVSTVLSRKPSASPIPCSTSVPRCTERKPLSTQIPFSTTCLHLHNAWHTVGAQSSLKEPGNTKRMGF